MSTWPGYPSRDMLWALIEWVEKDLAPDRLVAARITEGKTDLTRALCPYSQAAKYDGKGATDQASSYRCAVDPKLVDYLRRPSRVGS